MTVADASAAVIKALEALPEDERLGALRELLFDVMCEFEQEQVGYSAAAGLRNIDADMIPVEPVGPVTAEERKRRREARERSR